VALFAPQGALLVAVDDTVFHRSGKKIHGAFYQHDKFGARASPERRIEVVADALYRGQRWRELPQRTSLTTRLAANAALHARAPTKAQGRRGHPARKGPKLPALAEIARTQRWKSVKVSLYGKSLAMQMIEVESL
jgi:hypothetical protein